MSQALTKTQALILVFLIIVAVAGVFIAMQWLSSSQSSTTTTPPLTTTTTTGTTTTTATTTTTTPAGNTIVIGSTVIHVSSEFKQFVEDAKAGRVSVKIYFGHALTENERKAFQDIISMFKNEYPGIEVVEVAYSGMDVLKSQISAIATLSPEQRSNYIGKVPDLFTWAHDWIGSFADKGYILPLEEVLSSDTIINDIAPNLLPIALSAVTYNLKTYGLPYAGETIALIVNKNLVPNPPASFDEMLQVMKSFTNRNTGSYGLSYQADPYHLYPFVTAFGGYYYDEATKSIGVNSTGTKQGIKFYIQNVLPYVDVSDLGLTYQTNLFLNGKTPMMITGPWNIATINKSLGLSNIAIAPLPNIGDKVPKPFSGYRGIYITLMANVGGRERLYASVLFTLYVALNDNALKILVDKNNYVPVKNTMITYIQENKDKYPIVYGFLTQLMRSVPMPKDPMMDKVWNVGTYINAILGKYSEALQSGKTVDQAVAETLSVVDQQLDEAYASIVGK
ncbi:extracellular solute-binding protein [Desulfurococcus mucosus]|uniref:Extracellular solute-binding protein family 1 n=1 Tax=Desulfurococcus mucosus (strain ATCC 35584 / DSM 2162 / JCM 9187 / O7/1) TaxID=765177 RepID=E8R709_DESM0|nr:extracellular solute-binding protein [Desulfurococcus mucosus]ADV64442.1 extracellular solute-binding protein family 1 [Desulfurococcus mucosus DSM 2162]